MYDRKKNNKGIEMDNIRTVDDLVNNVDQLHKELLELMLKRCISKYKFSMMSGICNAVVHKFVETKQASPRTLNKIYNCMQDIINE